LSRETTRRIGREGLDVLDADDRARIGVDRPLEDARREALLDKLFEGHCGLMPKQALTPMLNVQRARDAAMADAVLTEAERDGAVLIAGAGHVRADWAVPWYLHARAPKLTVRTLAFIEADPESMAATDYFPPAIDGDLAYDYVWFTPRGTVIDHCAKLKERFSKTPMNHEKPAD